MHRAAPPDLEIRELRIPARLDASPDATAFDEMVRVRNEIEAAIIGNPDLAVEPAELLAMAHNPYDTWRCLVARAGGRTIGRAVYEVQERDAATAAWLQVEVLPTHRGHGVGSALFDAAEALARSDGLTTLQSSAYHLVGTGGGPQLQSPTGFGSVPVDHPATRFLTRRGFTLAQVDRMSRLPLPAAVEAPRAPEGYELVHWEGATPDELLDDMAVLHAGMSTDAPTGDVNWTPESWDAQRVRENDARRTLDGRRWLSVAVRHVASARLAGFTDLAVPLERSRPVMQHDTIVAKEHRGHRLGMLLKLANLHALDSVAPGHPAIYTWNAEENRHMLSVNEAVGFVAFGYESAWRRDS